MGLKTISKVENILIGLIKARYLLQYAQRFFCGFKDVISKAKERLIGQIIVESWLSDDH